MDNPPHECQFCAHGKAIPDADSIIAYECHHHAPSPMMLIAPPAAIITPQLVWPILESKGGCGDWKGMIE